MALGATVHHFEIGLSDVDRGVYEALDLRVARHPSESMRWLLLRTLAYCLAYEEGIGFSKGGLSAADEPPIAVHDPTGVRRAWIDIGSPGAERLHRAAKATPRVSIFTADLAAVRREAAARSIHKAESIEVWVIGGALLGQLEEVVGKNAKLDVLRNDGGLYVTLGATTYEGTIERANILPD